MITDPREDLQYSLELTLFLVVLESRQPYLCEALKRNTKL
jgi:hypothetical protein